MTTSFETSKLKKLLFAVLYRPSLHFQGRRLIFFVKISWHMLLVNYSFFKQLYSEILIDYITKIFRKPPENLKPLLKFNDQIFGVFGMKSLGSFNILGTSVAKIGLEWIYNNAIFPDAERFTRKRNKMNQGILESSQKSESLINHPQKNFFQWLYRWVDL